MIGTARFISIFIKKNLDVTMSEANRIEEDKNCLEKQQSEDNNLKFNSDLGITEKLLNKNSNNQLK